MIHTKRLSERSKRSLAYSAISDRAASSIGQLDHYDTLALEAQEETLHPRAVLKGLLGLRGQVGPYLRVLRDVSGDPDYSGLQLQAFRNRVSVRMLTSKRASARPQRSATLLPRPLVPRAFGGLQDPEENFPVFVARA